MADSRALFPGTFDPLTSGHHDLAMRGSALFGQITIAVSRSRDKKTMLPWQDRVNLAKIVFKAFSSIQICAFDGLLVDFAKVSGAHYILRGLRSPSDYTYESSMFSMNHSLNSDIETVFLMPLPECSFIASSQVKAIASMGGNISRFVPPEVNDFMTNWTQKS